VFLGFQVAEIQVMHDAESNYDPYNFAQGIPYSNYIRRQRALIMSGTPYPIHSMYLIRTWVHLSVRVSLPTPHPHPRGYTL
jgi:hypothetical protein